RSRADRASSPGYLAGSLAPLQQLAQAIEFFRINTRLFQNVQQELLMRVAEESADEVSHLEARGILAIHLRNVHVRALIFLLDVLHVTLFLQDADDGQDGVVGQSRLRG